MQNHQAQKILFRVSKLCLFEAFLEAAPQAILQISIVIRIGQFASAINKLVARAFNSVF